MSIGNESEKELVIILVCADKCTTISQLSVKNVKCSANVNFADNLCFRAVRSSMMVLGRFSSSTLHSFRILHE